MSTTRAFRQKLAAISRLWEANDYGAALTEVERLLEAWPGNEHLHILWASLVQLQDNPKHSLDDAKRALHQAIELNKSSPAGAIELGHFLDAVEDNPQAAARMYAEGVAAARRLLAEGLIGQAKALLQLDKRDDALRCLLEVLHLRQFDAPSRQGKAFADEAVELLGELNASRPALPLRRRNGMKRRPAG